MLLYLFFCVPPHPLGVGLHRPPRPLAYTHTHTPPRTPRGWGPSETKGLFLWGRVYSWGPSWPLFLTLTLDLTISSL